MRWSVGNLIEYVPGWTTGYWAQRSVVSRSAAMRRCQGKGRKARFPATSASRERRFLPPRDICENIGRTAGEDCVEVLIRLRSGGWIEG